MKNTTISIKAGVLALAFGLFSLTALTVIALFGPNVSSFTNVDASNHWAANLSRILFYSLLISFALSIVSLIKNEPKEISWNALAVGLSPVLIYLIGIIPTTFTLLILIAPQLVLFTIKK